MGQVKTDSDVRVWIDVTQYCHCHHLTIFVGVIEKS